MLHKGLQNKQIAYELKICETTVKVHVSDILRKLSVYSRTNAIIEIAKIDFASLAGGAPSGIHRPINSRFRLGHCGAFAHAAVITPAGTTATIAFQPV